MKDNAYRYKEELFLCKTWNIAVNGLSFDDPTNPNFDELERQMRQVTNDFLDAYVQGFIRNELDPDKTNYLTYAEHERLTLSFLKYHHVKYGETFWLKVRTSDFPRGYLFIHALLALKRKKFLSIREVNPFYEQVHESVEEGVSGYRVQVHLTKIFGEKTKKVSPLARLPKEERVLAVAPSMALPEITFDHITGVGSVNGKRFRFKIDTPEFRLFRRIFSTMNKHVKREDVLLLLGA